MTKLILDATSLICWGDELRDDIIFQSLKDAGFEFIIPERALSEVDIDELENPDVVENVKEAAEIRSVDPEQHEKMSDRYIGLGDGEISVLCIANNLKESTEYYCVLDDKAARKTSDRLGLSKKGNIGLVGELVQRDLMTLQRGRELLDKMYENETRLPENYPELLEQTVEQV